jgi:hypothetical protein
VIEALAISGTRSILTKSTMILRDLDASCGCTTGPRSRSP